MGVFRGIQRPLSAYHPLAQAAMEEFPGAGGGLAREISRYSTTDAERSVVAGPRAFQVGLALEVGAHASILESRSSYSAAGAPSETWAAWANRIRIPHGD